MSDNALIQSKSNFYTSSTNINPDDSNSLSLDKSYVGEFEIDLPRGLDTYEEEDGTVVKRSPYEFYSARSAHNPYFNVRVKTSSTKSGENYPRSDEESFSTKNLYLNATAEDLIDMPRGASMYSIDDFLYVKNYGKLPVNRMITLRRFAYPVFDDIFSKRSQSEPDIARLIGYSDQEINKLSEILSFSCGLKWKFLESASESGHMEGNQNGVDGIVGKVLKYVDPKFGKEALAGHAINVDPQHDNNRVYGPVDSINSVHIRDVGLKFDQKMELTFEYEMRSINGVNQKTAFIDILSNIILMCTNDAKFWGGARYWVGVQPSKYMKDLKALSPKNFNDFMTKGAEEMKSLFSTMSTKSNAKETLKNIANNAMNLALGKILDTLGRPGIPVMNSLLTGNPVGPWHITVGNPNNPIFCAGDLIMDDAQISFGDELGYDDFPTTIKVVITLMHPKGKGRAEIESMFNAGKGRVYMKPKELNDAKVKFAVKSKHSPKTASSKAGENNINTKDVFGDYSLSDVQRNADSVWGFLKTEASGLTKKKS